jgi:hypothetical protein
MLGTHYGTMAPSQSNLIPSPDRIGIAESCPFITIPVLASALVPLCASLAAAWVVAVHQGEIGFYVARGIFEF